MNLYHKISTLINQSYKNETDELLYRKAYFKKTQFWINFSLITVCVLTLITFFGFKFFNPLLFLPHIFLGVLIYKKDKLNEKEMLKKFNKLDKNFVYNLFYELETIVPKIKDLNSKIIFFNLVESLKYSYETKDGLSFYHNFIEINLFILERENNSDLDDFQKEYSEFKKTLVLEKELNSN